MASLAAAGLAARSFEGDIEAELEADLIAVVEDEISAEVDD
ncbi:MAG: hypothetical protein ACYSW8_33240 [Planctomycetota bacterium]|jgi:hypothetical protein